MLMIIAALAAAPSPLPAAPFDFQGTALGSVPGDLLTIHSDATCESQEAGRSECHRRRIKIGSWDASADYYYRFTAPDGDRKLYKIALYFLSVGAVKQIADGLEERWGTPTEEYGSLVWRRGQSRAEYRFSNQGGSVIYTDGVISAAVAAEDKAASAKDL